MRNVEEVREAIEKAVRAYCKDNKDTLVQSEEVTVGGIHPKTTGCYFYVFAKDPVVFNLLAGKNEEGEDLCDLVYEYPPEHQRDGLTDKVLPIDLDKIDITLDDLVEDNQKCNLLLEMMRGVEDCKEYGAKIVKKWKDPILRVSLNNETLKIVPAALKVDRLSLGPKILLINRALNPIPERELQLLLDKICVRSDNRSFYVRDGVIQSKSPLVLNINGYYEIHFLSEMLCKMCYYMLQGMQYVTNGKTFRISCVYRHNDGSGRQSQAKSQYTSARGHKNTVYSSSSSSREPRESREASAGGYEGQRGGYQRGRARGRGEGQYRSKGKGREVCH